MFTWHIAALLFHQQRSEAVSQQLFGKKGKLSLFEREHNSMIQTSLRFRIFRLTLLATGILLLLQYVFRMLVNLYVQFPSTLPHGDAWGWAFTESVSIQIHVYLGTLLLVVALVSLVLSVLVRSIPAVVASIIGFAMTILAYLGGIWFLSYGQQSVSSLWMALGFLGAVLAYGVGYVATRHKKGESDGR